MDAAVDVAAESAAVISQKAKGRHRWPGLSLRPTPLRTSATAFASNDDARPTLLLSAQSLHIPASKPAKRRSKSPSRVSRRFHANKIYALAPCGQGAILKALSKKGF